MQAVRPLDPWLDAVVVMLIPGKGLWNVLLPQKARSPVLYSLLTNLLNWVAPQPCPQGLTFGNANATVGVCAWQR